MKSALFWDLRGMILDPGRYTLYKDAVSVLGRCGEMSFSQYILFNNHPDLKGTLDALGLGPYFANVIASGEIGYGKPRREIFRHALEGAGRPGRCFMIGDNPCADGEGAINAGIPTLLVHLVPPIPSIPCFDTLGGAAAYVQEALYDNTHDGYRRL